MLLSQQLTLQNQHDSNREVEINLKNLQHEYESEHSVCLSPQPSTSQLKSPIQKNFTRRQSRSKSNSRKRRNPNLLEHKKHKISRGRKR